MDKSKLTNFKESQVNGENPKEIKDSTLKMFGQNVKENFYTRPKDWIKGKLEPKENAKTSEKLYQEPIQEKQPSRNELKISDRKIGRK